MVTAVAVLLSADSSTLVVAGLSAITPSTPPPTRVTVTPLTPDSPVSLMPSPSVSKNTVSPKDAGWTIPASISGLFSPEVRVTTDVTPEASASESAASSVPALASAN